MKESRKTDCTKTDRSYKGMPKVRRAYCLRFIFRVLVFVACVITALYKPHEYYILKGWNFFRRFSLFHLLWVIWIVDMLL